MRLPQEPDDQSQETNLKSWRYRTSCLGDAMTLLLLLLCCCCCCCFFFFKGNGSLKIDRSVKRHDIGLVWKLFAPSHGSSLNFPDKCENHFALSSYDFSACKTCGIYNMKGGPQVGNSNGTVHSSGKFPKKMEILRRISLFLFQPK